MLEEQKLLTKIASLYYEEGLKQSQISEQLDLSQSFISRSLNRALKEGIVKISVHRPVHFHIDLERQLQEQYEIRQVLVVEPTGAGDDALKQAIGSAAAHYFETTVTEKDKIGISSWSSTIRAMIDHMHRSRQKGAAEVVQLLGGVGNKGAFEATLLTQRLATLLNCPSYLLPSQSIEQSVDSRLRILQLDDVREVVDRFSALTVALVGIGELEPSPLLRNSGNYHSQSMLKTLADRGAVGDICLRYYDASGAPVLEDNEEVVVSVNLQQLHKIDRVVGLAGGERKLNAIRGALCGKYLDVLITDLTTAKALAAQP